jgi:uroporphyrinogen decarboxylase
MEGKTMNSRERVKCALDHKEPDRIPFDFGGTVLTSISRFNYNNFRLALGLPEVNPKIMDIFQQNVLVDEDMLSLLECDVRPVLPESPYGFKYDLQKSSDGYSSILDEWGIGWKKPDENGLYFDMYSHPLSGELSIEKLSKFPWPDPTEPNRFIGMTMKANHYAVKESKAVALHGFCSGVVEMAAWLRGYSDFYLDIAQNDTALAYLLDKIVELKEAYWEVALSEAGDYVDVIIEADDMAGQFNLLISPNSYRKIVKPRHKKLFQFIKDRTSAKLFFHSCGAIRPLIPDLIEIGVDILNPVQVNAKGMNSAELKKEYGEAITFWGGGVDTQGAFGSSNPQVFNVDNDVKNRIIDFRPNGGFIFATVHNIQANVAVDNIVAMWNKFRELRSY